MGPFGRVIVFPPQGPFDHVGPCGCVSTARLFGHVGPVVHLDFQLDAVSASYCTMGKRFIG